MSSTLTTALTFGHVKQAKSCEASQYATRMALFDKVEPRQFDMIDTAPALTFGHAEQAKSTKSKVANRSCQTKTN
jgi:hypothetical protein